MLLTGSLLSTRPSKHLTKRSSSNEDSDAPNLCASPPPTKQGKTVSSRLSKQSESVKQHQKSPVKDSADPMLSVSKLPTRRSSDKLKSRKPSDSPDDNSDRSKKDLNQSETAGKDSESKIEDKQSDDKKSALKAKDGITSSTSIDISEIPSALNNDDTIRANAKAVAQTDSLNSNEISKAIPAQSLVTDDNNAEKQHEGEQQTKLKSSSHTQSDNTTQEQQILLLPENSSEEVDFAEATQLIPNLQPDFIQEKETYPSVLDQDTAPGNKDVNDMSDKPVVGNSILSETIKNFEEEGAMPSNVSLKAKIQVTSTEEAIINSVSAKSASKDQGVEPKHGLSATSSDISADTNLTNTDQQKQKEKAQTTTISFANNTLPSTLSIGSVESKEDVGRKPLKALDIQTEAVTVCELHKNFENQLNREPLLLAGTFGRHEKDSKPTEELNDAAVESSRKHSKTSCTEDKAAEEVTKQEKPSSLSLEDKDFQSDSDNAPQTVVTDVLEEKSTEAEHARNDTIATVVDRKQSTSKKTQQAEQKIKASSVKNEQLLTKDDNVREDNMIEEDKKCDEKIKATSAQMDTQGNKTGKSLPSKTARSEVSNQEVQLEDSKKTENTGFGLVDSKYPNTNLEQKPGTHDAPGKALKTHILQMETTHKLTESNTSERNTETKNSSTQNLVNETMVLNADTEICIQQDQSSLIIGEQHVNITKPDENKLTESKCPNNKLKQEPDRGRTKVQEMTTESQKTDASQELNSLSTSTKGTRENTDIGFPDKAQSKDSTVNSLNGAPTAIANNEVSNQQVQGPKLSGDQAQKITKPEKNKSTEPKCPYNELEEAKERVRTKVQKKITESEKTDICQELNLLSSSAEGTIENTDIKDSSLSLGNNTGVDAANLVSKEEKSVIVKEPDTITTKVLEMTKEYQNEKTGTIKELNLVGTSAKDATEMAQSQDSSVKTFSGVTNVIANIEVSNQLVQKPISSGDQAQNIKKTEKKGAQNEKLDSSLSTSANVTKEETGTKDSSQLQHVNLKPVVIANSEVSNREVHASVTSGYQDGDITKLEKKHSIESNFRCPNTDIKKETETDTNLEGETKDLPIETGIRNANFIGSAQTDQKTSTVTDEEQKIRKPEENIGQAIDSKAPNAHQEHELKSIIKVSKLPDKSGVSTTEKVATKGDAIHIPQNTVKECVQDQKNDQTINTSEIYVKQDSKKVSGEQTDKFSYNADETVISTHFQKNDADTEENIKTDALKQKLQTSRKETILNVSDPQKPTGSMVNVSSSLPATVKPSQGLKTESPSSWLDLEHKQTQKKQHKKRLNSSASEDESLELDDVDDFIRSIKKGGAPFALPPKRHFRKKSSSPSPRFAMPAIKEDHFERTFDPEEFKFGLSKNGKALRDPSPAMVIKQKAANRERRTLGKGAQDNALPTPQDQMTLLDEVDGADGVKGEERQNNGEEPGKLTSRLERMSILSSLLSSPRTSRKTKEETTCASNSKLSSNQQQDLRSLEKQGAGVDVDKEGVKITHQGQYVGGDIGKVSESALSPSSLPPLPTFSEVKLPDHLEKYLKTNTKESEASQGSALMTKTKLNPEGATLMDQVSVTGALNVDARLPLTGKYNQQKPPKGFSTSKPKVFNFK